MNTAKPPSVLVVHREDSLAWECLKTLSEQGLSLLSYCPDGASARLKSFRTIEEKHLDSAAARAAAIVNLARSFGEDREAWQTGFELHTALPRRLLKAAKNGKNGRYLGVFSSALLGPGDSGPIGPGPHRRNPGMDSPALTTALHGEQTLLAAGRAGLPVTTLFLTEVPCFFSPGSPWNGLRQLCARGVGTGAITGYVNILDPGDAAQAIARWVSHPKPAPAYLLSGHTLAWSRVLKALGADRYGIGLSAKGFRAVSNLLRAASDLDLLKPFAPPQAWLLQQHQRDYDHRLAVRDLGFSPKSVQAALQAMAERFA